MKKISVAIIVSKFPNFVQTYILSLITSLKNAGIETTIIANEAGEIDCLPPAFDKYHLLENTIYVNTEQINILKGILTIPIFNTKYSKSAKKILTSLPILRYGWRYYVKTFVRIKTLAFRDFNIIHSHNLTISYDYLFLKELFSIPIVTTFHGKEPIGSKSIDNEKVKVLFEKGDIFLVNTEYAKNQLKEMGCPQGKIRIIPQGTSLDEFPFQKRSININQKIVLLTVARLSIEKGHHVAIQAIAKLATDFPAIEYHLVGDGPERSNIENLISKLKLQDKIKLHGRTTDEELLQHYKNAHLFILPSINTNDDSHVETQGVVLQEAQANGLVVIGSMTGGIPDVIRNYETGMLYKESDHHRLAEIIKTLINNPDLYQKISHAGRLDVEKRFDINKVCKKIISIYEELVKV